MSRMTAEDTHTAPAKDLARAVRLHEEGRHEEARTLLLGLSARHPRDALVAYRTAWIHDLLGLESEAAPHYERALAGDGLGAEDRRGAMLGLGSTYRVLGRYAEAVETLRAGVVAFPGDGALRTFLAMALYNTDAHHEAMRTLLELLVTTSEDPGVRTYRRAITHYAQDLDETV